MKLDGDDLSILRVLSEDGRASLREVAARTSLSTPTVSLRLSRMLKGGLVKGFAPVINPAAAHEVYGFVKLRAHARDTGRVTRQLANVPEVRGVFVTTGSDNIMVRVAAADVDSLGRFISRKMSGLEGAEIASTDIVTEVVKDVNEVRLKADTPLPLKCDYCGGEVASDRPYNIKVGSTYHYFCCRTCRRSYVEENRARIARAGRSANQ